MSTDIRRHVVQMPVLTWKPTPMNAGVALSLVVVLAVAMFPVWGTAPATALLVTVGTAVLSLLVGISYKRWVAVIEAHVSNRGETTLPQRAAIIGARAGDLPPILPVVCVVMSVAVLPGWFLADPSLRPGVSSLVALEAMLLITAVLVGGLGWTLSPWFRVRWSIMAAAVVGGSQREAWMLRALDNDPERPHTEQARPADGVGFEQQGSGAVHR